MSAEQPKVRLTRTGKPDGRSISSRKNVSKAREAVKQALKKTFHPDEDVTSDEESDTDDECYETVPIQPRPKQPVQVAQPEPEYSEEIVERDLRKSKKKHDNNWEIKLQEELRKQEESWNDRMKKAEDLYQKQIRETEEKYIQAKVGTINNLRRSMMLKF